MVDAKGPADPGMIGHGCRVGHKKDSILFLSGIYQGPDKDGSEVTNIVRLTHVRLNRHNVSCLFEVVQPPGTLEDLDSLDGPSIPGIVSPWRS